MANFKVKNITVTLSENNSCHETLDSLICDVCNKRVERVYSLYPKQNDKDVRFACTGGECFLRLFKEMFMIYEDEYLMACSITDINYKNRKETKKRVRAEMTLKLRYQIMKRDNFQCVVCGRRPPVVELCVDHIKPVVKGGKSEEGNLRTLCTDCNLGKGVE